MPRIAEPKIEYRPRKRLWVVTFNGRKVSECSVREGCEAFVKGWREASEERRTAQSVKVQEKPQESLTVTKLHVAGTRGQNRQPSFGAVTFSDGKSYSFMRLPGNGDHAFSFGGWRKRRGAGERFSFSSDAREAALVAYLDN